MQFFLTSHFLNIVFQIQYLLTPVISSLHGGVLCLDRVFYPGALVTPLCLLLCSSDFPVARSPRINPQRPTPHPAILPIRLPTIPLAVQRMVQILPEIPASAKQSRPNLSWFPPTPPLPWFWMSRSAPRFLQPDRIFRPRFLRRSR